MYGISYNERNRITYDLLVTPEFDEWFSEQPGKLQALVKARLDFLTVGHFGDHKRFDGLIELRWRNGTRVYTFQWGKALVVVAFGGNKNGQNRDIQRAKKIRREILAGLQAVRE